MLQGLEGAEERAELPAHLEVFHGDFLRAAHDPYRFGAQCGERAINDPFDGRQRGAVGVERGAGIDPDVRELDIRGAHAILHDIAAPLDSARACIDQKQPDAVAIAPLAGYACADEQLIGAIAMQHVALVSVDDPTATVAARARVHIEEVIAGLAFGMCEGREAFAGDDRGNELGSLRRAVRIPAAVRRRGALWPRTVRARASAQRPP